jgi:hypothetical protein
MNLLPCVAPIINQLSRTVRMFAKWGLMTLALSLSACSLVVTGYNNGPQLMMFSWINPHLDLSSAQERQVLADLERIQAWHRQQQLPLYQQWLQQMQAMAPHNIQASQVCKLFDEMRQSLPPLAAQMEEPTARLALSLQSKQFTVLKKRFDKDNQSWRKDWQLDGSTDDQLEAQSDKGEENAQRIYGRLDRNQKTLLRQLAKDAGFDGAKTMAERLRQQADSLSVLQTIATQQPSVREATAWVHDWFERSLQTPDEAYAGYLRKRQTLNCEAAAQFHNTTTASQRAHAVKTLKGYEDDVRKLMRTPD